MTFMVSYIIVCGHPRSGSTMLRSLLSSHPEMFVLHEMGVFDLVDAPPVEEYLARVRRHSFNGLGADYQAWLRARPVRERFEAVMRGRAARNVHFDDALAGLRETLRQPRILGDKHPGYLDWLTRYPDDPRVTYVIIYRDGRAVVNSAMEMRRGPWKDQQWAAVYDHPVAGARSWLTAVHAMEQQAHRAVILRYEELVTDARRALTPLADILGIDVRRFDFRLPQQTRLDRWRTAMNPLHVRLVEATAGQALRRLGYLD
jgi:hypothetical protein